MEGKFYSEHAPNRPVLLPGRATTTQKRNVWQPGGLHGLNGPLLVQIMQLELIFVKQPMTKIDMRCALRYSRQKYGSTYSTT
jgi:hypothetical protein